MNLADAHIHLFPEGFRRAGQRSLFGTRELEAYCALRETHGIERALAIGYEADGIDPGNNGHLRRLAAQHDWLHSLAYVAPAPGPAPEAIARLLRDGHSGLALYAPDGAQAEALLRWERPVWNVLREARALVSLNAPPDSIAILAALVAEVPEVSFLFSHLGLPGRIAPDAPDTLLRERLSSLLGLVRSSNAFVKISGLYATSDPAYAYPHRGGGRAARILLERFGPERSLWASDFSPALEFVSFPQVIDVEAIAALPAADRALVLRDNLVRLLDAVRGG